MSEPDVREDYEKYEEVKNDAVIAYIAGLVRSANNVGATVITVEALEKELQNRKGF